MNAIKSIVFWLVYICLAIIKLPITLIVALGLWIEKIFMDQMLQLAKWYGDKSLIEGINMAFEATAWGCEVLSEEYRDMEDEV